MVYGHGKIGRNVTISHCYGQRVICNGTDPPELVDFSADVFGCFTEQRATRYFRRIMGDNTITVNKVEFETHYYAMELSKFMNQAERTDNDL